MEELIAWYWYYFALVLSAEGAWLLALNQCGDGCGLPPKPGPNPGGGAW